MLVNRTFKFIGNSQRATVIQVGLDAPFKASIEGLEGFLECPIHLGYENAGRSSVFDLDPISVIESGLNSIQSFLNSLSLQGSVVWNDGRIYKFGDIDEIRIEVWQKTGLQSRASDD